MQWQGPGHGRVSVLSLVAGTGEEAKGEGSLEGDTGLGDTSRAASEGTSLQEKRAADPASRPGSADTGLSQASAATCWLRNGCDACFSVPRGGSRWPHTPAPRGGPGLRHTEPAGQQEPCWRGGHHLPRTLCHTTLGHCLLHQSEHFVPAQVSPAPQVPLALRAGPAPDKQAQTALSPTAAPAPSPGSHASTLQSLPRPLSHETPRPGGCMGPPEPGRATTHQRTVVSCGGPTHTGAQRTGAAAPRVPPAEPTWLGQRHEPWGMAARGPQGAVEEAGVRLGPAGA